MALSEMQVFNEYVMPATIERLAQMVNQFNQASGGAIRLTTDGFDGDFYQESFFKGLSGAQRRVDRYAANADVTPIDLSQDKHVSVKVAGGIGPVRFEPSQLTWLRTPTAKGIDAMSTAFAELMLSDQLNTSIGALVAAIGNQADAVNDVSTTAGIDYIAVNGAHAKFGDSSGNLIADVMNGLTYHKLIGNNLANTAQLFQAGNVRVVDILGKLAVVTDAPALFESSTPDKVKILTLTDSAAVVSDGGDVISNIETSNGKERIESTMQVDYTFGIGLKGYAWDSANGGKSPSDAELQTGANWLMNMSSIKNTAGVMTVGDATK